MRPQGTLRLSLFHFTMLALALLLVSVRAALSQACDNTNGLAPITNGAVACITNGGPTPNMPYLAFTTQTSSTCGGDTVQMSLNLSYSKAGSPGAEGYVLGSGGYYESPADLPAGSEWMVDWTDNLYDDSYYEGGAATTSFSVNGGSWQTGLTFSVLGANPTDQEIVASVNYMTSIGTTVPWWFGRMFNKESTTQQFNASGTDVGGTPKFGTPDGWGIAQLDGFDTASYFSSGGTLADDDLWSYFHNIQDAAELANSKNSAAFSYWGTQLDNMLSKQGSHPIYPSTGLSVGPTCQFTSWTGTGSTAYGNTEWMASYNSGHFATWTGSSWSIGNIAYVAGVNGICSTATSTI